MVQQGIAEVLSGVCVIFGNVADDISEILQRSSREEEAEIHLGRSSRTCSTETVRPDLTSRSPSDRKSTRLNSSHLVISYAVFCLKKKKTMVQSMSLSPRMQTSS